MNELRLARLEEVEEIAALQKASLAALGAGLYSPEALAAGLRYVCRPEERLIADGTYFVVAEAGRLCACGGWSFRAKPFAGPAGVHGDDARLVPGRDAARVRAMFTAPQSAGQGLGSRILQRCEQDARAAGFSRVLLGATLSGERFYRARGYREIGAEPAILEDGTAFPVTLMEKAL